jgi:hypothetical protein
MKKKVKVLMLPTEKALVIGETSLITSHNPLTGDRLDYGIIKNLESTFPTTTQHLYFTSDEEIKEGDWVIFDHIKIPQQIKRHFKTAKEEGARKIIATTDKSLKFNHKVDMIENDGYPIYHIKNNGIPQIPESFIKAYVEANGEIDEVMVEYEEDICINCGRQHCDNLACRGHEDIDELKTADDNTVIIHSV